GVRHEPGQPVAEIEDLAEVASFLVAHGGRLRDGRDDVARVRDLHMEPLGELLVEPRVADRRRPHVDTAPPRAEVERRPDPGNLAGSLVHTHGAEANAPGGGDPATLTAAQPRRGSSAGRALG